MQRSTRLQFWFPAVVGLLAALASLGRICWANSSGLTQILWAEDGLFTLCAEKVGVLSCVVDPYAGYSTFLPRLFAGITSLFAPSSWALVANVLAALLVGITSGILAWWLQRFGFGKVTSASSALLIVLAPIVGFEVINVFACAYVPLLVLGTIMIVFPIDPYPTKTVSVVLLIATLTIPTAALLLGPLAIQIFVKKMNKRIGGIVAASIFLGLAVQVAFIATTSIPRATNLGMDSFSDWVSSMPIALLTFIPGLNIGKSTIFTNYSTAPGSALNWVIILGLVAIGTWLIFKRTGVGRNIGLLMVTALALGAAPAIFLAANVRYFVVPCLLIGVAFIVMLDTRIRQLSPLALVMSAGVVLLVWWPSLPASQWRTTPAPAWQTEVARVAAHCKSDQSQMERPIFTPFFPPNWGDGMVEPTYPALPCSIGSAWH